MSANDGGPAFPLAHSHRDLAGTNWNDANGMSLRDYFAAKAIAIVGRQADLDNAGTPELAAACYEFADEMIAERERPLVERINDRLAADNQHARAQRLHAALEALVNQIHAVEAISSQIGSPLDDAVALLADEEIPF